MQERDAAAGRAAASEQGVISGLRPRARVLGRAGRPVTPPYSAASREPAPASRNRLAEVEEGCGTRRRAASPPLRSPGSPPLLFLRATSSAGLTNALSGIHSDSCHEEWQSGRAGTIGPVSAQNRATGARV
jgi:hypothetical protein